MEENKSVREDSVKKSLQVKTTNRSESGKSLIRENNPTPSDAFTSTISVATSSSEKNSNKSCTFVCEKFDSHQQDSKPTTTSFEDLDFAIQFEPIIVLEDSGPEDLDSMGEFEEQETITLDILEESEMIRLRQPSQDIELQSKAKESNTEIHNTEEKPLIKSKKGPPGLLPLDQNSPTPENPEVRSPRKAALKSAETIINVMADFPIPSANQSSGKKDIPEEPTETANSDGSNITVHKIKDPNYDLCRGCNKISTCIFDTTGEKGQELQFCSKKCVQGYFKSGDVHYANFREKNGGKNNLIQTRDSLQEIQVLDHVVTEPDIEIHTLSDEFQMDFDDSEINSCNANSASPAMYKPSEVDQLVEKAAKETLCCCSCRISLFDKTDSLTWESMEFCSENCLKTYVKVIGSHCNMCNSQVAEHILGKLCVRFGTVIRQFCSPECLEKFKGSHKLCAQCQVNMTDKEKTFCSKSCEDLSCRLKNQVDFFGRRHCGVCKEYRLIKEEVHLSGRSHWLCGKPCLKAFLFSNKMTALSCGVCSRNFDISVTPRYVSRNTDSGFTWYCSNVCFAVHLLRTRKIALCIRCQVKKYNIDMIRKPTGHTVCSKGSMEAEIFSFCSLYCYSLHMNPSARELARRKGLEAIPPVASTATPPPAAVSAPIVRPKQTTNFGIANLLSKPMTLQPPARPILLFNHPSPSTQVPVFFSRAPTPVTNTNQTAVDTSSLDNVEVINKIVFVPPNTKEMKNKSVSCRPVDFSQNVNAGQINEATVDPLKTRPITDQSKEGEKRPFFIPIPIPIPVPIYVPIPMCMYNFPVPYPVGLPLIAPIILPVDSAMMKKIEEFKKNDEADMNCASAADEESSESDNANTMLKDTSQNISINHSKQRDLADGSMVNDSSPSSDESNLELEIPSCTILLVKNPGVVTRKRSYSMSSSSLPEPKRLKDNDCNSGSSDSDDSFISAKSDSPKLHVKVTGGFQKELGLKAWSNWTSRSKRPVSSKLHEMKIQELNTSLVDFLREFRKPNGEKYRPDVILYFICGLQQTFCLDRQQHNLFMDTALEPFQKELDKELQPFYERFLNGIRADTTTEMKTTLKESHLWACRQLGAHSPIVLVFTMLYFNTKYFRLYTPEQHRSLAFTNIHKSPKKNISNGSSGKSTNEYQIQFVPMMEQAKSPNFIQKKPLEIPQNLNHPSNCPIKYYNFYLSKCPESMKLRKDMFYLLPEVTCSSESPLWYTSQPVPQDILARMLRRVLFIEEVLRNLCAPE